MPPVVVVSVRLLTSVEPTVPGVIVRDVTVVVATAVPVSVNLTATFTSASPGWGHP